MCDNEDSFFSPKRVSIELTGIKRLPDDYVPGGPKPPPPSPLEGGTTGTMPMGRDEAFRVLQERLNKYGNAPYEIDMKGLKERAVREQSTPIGPGYQGHLDPWVWYDSQSYYMAGAPPNHYPTPPRNGTVNLPPPQTPFNNGTVNLGPAGSQNRNNLPEATDLRPVIYYENTFDVTKSPYGLLTSTPYPNKTMPSGSSPGDQSAPTNYYPTNERLDFLLSPAIKELREKQLDPPQPHKSPMREPNSMEDEFITHIDNYSNKILDEFKDKMAKELPPIFQQKVNETIDELLTPELLKSVLENVLPTMINNSIRQIAENSVNYFLTSELTETVIEKVLPLIVQGALTCTKPCHKGKKGTKPNSGKGGVNSAAGENSIPGSEDPGSCVSGNCEELLGYSFKRKPLEKKWVNGVPVKYTSQQRGRRMDDDDEGDRSPRSSRSKHVDRRPRRNRGRDDDDEERCPCMR